MRSECETIVLGDVNICFSQKNSPIYKEYSALLKLFSLDQIITEPTRITPTSSSVLDHILCNNKDKISQSGTISVGLSDHLLTFCTRKLCKVKSFSHNTVKIRSLKNYSKDELVTKLLLADWSKYFSSSNVNEAWNAFKAIFTEILDIVAPVKEVRLKAQSEPWITTEILDKMKLRDGYLHRFKKYKNREDFKHF